MNQADTVSRLTWGAKYLPDGQSVILWRTIHDYSLDRPLSDEFQMELVFLDTTAEGRILKTTGGRFLEVLGASKDGQWFYYAIESDGNTVEIVREHMIDGNEEILTELSIDNVAGVNMTKDYSTFLITVDEGKSDIWMIEDFDPEVE